MRDDNKDIYDIRKQEEGIVILLLLLLLINFLLFSSIVLQESLMMVPDSKNRLEVTLSSPHLHLIVNSL